MSWLLVTARATAPPPDAALSDIGSPVSPDPDQSGRPVTASKAVMLFTCCNGWAAVGVTGLTQEPATTCPPAITRPPGMGEPTLLAASVRDHRFLPVAGLASVTRPPLVV